MTRIVNIAVTITTTMTIPLIQAKFEQKGAEYVAWKPSKKKKKKVKNGAPSQKE